MSFQKWYDNFKKNSYSWRSKNFQPLLKFLADKKITPNQVTLFRLFFVFPIVYYFLLANLWGVLVFYVLFWLIDLVDGALARFTNTANDRGRFADSIVDNFVYCLAIVGFIYLQTAWAWLLAYNIVIELFTQLLATIKKQENKPTDWIINSAPDAPYFKSLAHLGLLLYVFGYNLLNPLFLVLNIWLTITSISYFLIILRRK